MSLSGMGNHSIKSIFQQAPNIIDKKNHPEILLLVYGNRFMNYSGIENWISRIWESGGHSASSIQIK